MSHLKNKLAASILSGSSLNFNNDQNLIPDYLNDNVFSTRVPEYIEEGQIGVSINITGPRNRLLEQISKSSNIVLQPGVSDQELVDILTEEITTYTNILSWADDLDIENHIQFQYQGQKAAIRHGSNKSNLFAATVLSVDLKELKLAAAIQLYRVSVRDCQSLEEVITTLQTKYSNHDIISNVLFGLSKKLPGSPLKVAFAG